MNNFENAQKAFEHYYNIIPNYGIDFDGTKFLEANINGKMLNDKIIEKYAPNVVEGIKKLSNWAKNL